MRFVRRGGRKDELLSGLDYWDCVAADVLAGLRDRASFKNPMSEILDRDVQSKMIIEEGGRYKRTKRPIPVPYRSAFDYHLDGTIPMKDAGHVMCVSLGTG
jgi:hypothetical protein